MRTILLLLLLAAAVVVLSFVLLPRNRQIGEALEHAGRYDEAIGYYQAGLRFSPRDESTLVRIASIHILLGRPDQAIAVYRRLTEIDPSNIGYHRQLALLYDWSLLRDEAMAQREEIAQLDPNDVAVRQELADYLIAERKDYAGAIKRFEEIAAARSDDVEALRELGRLYGLGKQLPQAITAYRRALDLQPGDLTIGRSLGRVYDWNGQPSEAIAQYRANLEIDPNNRETLIALEDILRRTGQIDEADRIAQRIANLPSER